MSSISQTITVGDFRKDTGDSLYPSSFCLSTNSGSTRKIIFIYFWLKLIHATQRRNYWQEKDTLLKIMIVLTNTFPLERARSIEKLIERNIDSILKTTQKSIKKRNQSISKNIMKKIRKTS